MTATMKNRPIDILIGALLIYLFLGLGVVSIQALSGASCSPIQLGGRYVYEVDRNAPRFWLWRAVRWLPTAWENVVVDDVSLGDFMSPRKCLWVPEGKTPAEVWEKQNPSGAG